MTRYRVDERTLWTVALVLILLQASRSECQLASLPAPAKLPPSAATAADTTCAVYSLAEFGEDPGAGIWIADTLLKLIESGTWQGEGSGRWLLNYHPPTRVLVVHHTPAVQAKVAAFLQDVRKAMPGARNNARGAGQEMAVIQAGATAPAPLRPVEPGASPSYVVPRPTVQPRHLFHFIVRYEGDGIGGATEMIEDAASLAGVTTAGSPAHSMEAVPPGGVVPPANVSYAPPSYAPTTIVMPSMRVMPAVKD